MHRKNVLVPVGDINSDTLILTPLGEDSREERSRDSKTPVIAHVYEPRKGRERRHLACTEQHLEMREAESTLNIRSKHSDIATSLGVDGFKMCKSKRRLFLVEPSDVCADFHCLGVSSVRNEIARRLPEIEYDKTEETWLGDQ
jgi:hypothetical protein